MPQQGEVLHDPGPPAGVSLDTSTYAKHTNGVVQQDAENLPEEPVWGQGESLVVEGTDGNTPSPPTLDQDWEEDSPIEGFESLRIEESEGSNHSALPDVSEQARGAKTASTQALYKNAFFEIRPSPIAGLGAFALKDLKYGDCILMEPPLLVIKEVKDLNGGFENLDEERKRAYLSLTGFSLNGDTPIVTKIFHTNAFHLPQGMGIFTVTSRFNHACNPVCNVRCNFDCDCGTMNLTIAHDRIPAGTELLISYGPRPADLYRVWGIRCACGACTPATDEELGLTCKETPPN